jgi:hypothetical protein
LDHQEQRVEELKLSIDKLNETIGQMTRTFIAAQVCEQRVAKMEGEQSEMAKAVLLLTTSSKTQQEAIDKLVPLVSAHEVTVGEVRKLKQLLLGGIGLSAIVNPTAREILAKALSVMSGQ